MGTQCAKQPLEWYVEGVGFSPLFLHCCLISSEPIVHSRYSYHLHALLHALGHHRIRLGHNFEMGWNSHPLIS